MNLAYVVTITRTLMSGVGVVTFLFVLSLGMSIPLGFLITLLLRTRFKPVAAMASAYVYVVRGTPLLLQLFFIYYGLPYMPYIGSSLRFSSLTAAVLGFTLNYAAYFAEIFRGGLLAIDPGQYEASKVLGLTKTQTMLHIVCPQMIRVVLPSITNESVTLIKDTALIYAVAVPEILHFAKVTVSRDANPLAFVVAFVIYLLMNSLLTLLFRLLERKVAY